MILVIHFCTDKARYEEKPECTEKLEVHIAHHRGSEVKIVAFVLSTCFLELLTDNFDLGFETCLLEAFIREGI